MDKHEKFLEALHNKKKVEVTINSKEKGIIIRLCVPLDFGPSRRSKSQQDKYHLHDINSPDGPHILSIVPSQLLEIKILKETFDPADYVTWKPVDWFTERDWGDFS